MKVRIHGGKFERILRVTFAVSCSVALMALLSVTAQARPSDPFNPALKICTDTDPCPTADFVHPSSTFGETTPLGGTTAANGHPYLALQLTKPISKCSQDWDGNPWHPGDIYCPDSSLTVEQDLKKLAISFPPGLLADANAAPYCNVQQAWLWDNIDQDPGGAGNQHYGWKCDNPEALIGWGLVSVAYCDPTPNFPPNPSYVPAGYAHCQSNAMPQTGNPMLQDGTFIPMSTMVYNEQPKEGEQGHLVMLVGAVPPDEHPDVSTSWRNNGLVKIDISITLRSDGGMNVVSDMIPDSFRMKLRSYIPSSGAVTNQRTGDPYPGFQIPYMYMELGRLMREDPNHPLLTNPTFCDPQSLDVETQGYLNNTVDVPGDPQGIDINGSGDGTTPPKQSLPYQVTGCDDIPYNPKASLKFENNGPDQASAITSTITQEQGEATTKTVKVAFPDAFKVNAQNKATFCSEQDLSARTCPDSSKVGEVKAFSHLLPDKPDNHQSPLNGEVYLTGLKGDSIGISMLLHGFVNLRIDGSGKLTPDGRLQTTFDNLPAVPLERFDLTLFGGEKGLLRTPKVCGQQTISSVFTSHSGKTTNGRQDVNIAGCNDPELTATLSTKKPGARTNLELSVASPGTRLDSVEFGVARHLHWGIKNDKTAKASSEGSLTFSTSGQNDQTSKLHATRTRAGNIRLAPTSKGIEAFSGLSATLFRTRQNQPNLTNRGVNKKTHKKVLRQSNLVVFGGLENQHPTGITLALKSQSGRLSLRNPTGCKRPLNFVAFVTTADGNELALKKQVRLKGKGCG